MLSFEKGRLAESPFVRGDANVDGSVNISDAVRILDYLFRAGERFSCDSAADANDDGRFSVTDVTWTLLNVVEGKVLPEPSVCGADATADELRCESFGQCN